MFYLKTQKFIFSYFESRAYLWKIINKSLGKFKISEAIFVDLPFFIKVARNEVKNASFAQRSAHRDSRIWRPELIEPAAERRRRARGRRPTFKSAYPDPQFLPQCNISSNYPYNVWFFWFSRHRSIILVKNMETFSGRFWEIPGNVLKLAFNIENVNWSQKRLDILPSSLWKVYLKFFLQMNPIPMRKKQLLSIRSSRFQPEKRKTRMFFRLFFRLSAHLRPHSSAIFRPNTHIIFCCPLSAYDKWWFEQKKITTF